jgi:hypothetical protein
MMLKGLIKDLRESLNRPDFLDYNKNFCNYIIPKLEESDQQQDKIIEYLRSLQGYMCDTHSLIADIDDRRRDLTQILELIDNPSGTKEKV